MSADQDLALLQTWAPIVNVHPQEAYLPCSVEWYLAQCEFLYYDLDYWLFFAYNGNIFNLTNLQAALAAAAAGASRPAH
jgi:Vacuolar protein sorting-associated protein 62